MIIDEEWYNQNVLPELAEFETVMETEESRLMLVGAGSDYS